MAVSPALVKQLRDMTGAGMMDCKKALEENDGDVDKALEFLQKKGQASAVKKAGRIASEGAVVAYIAPKGDVGALFELNCESDFVSRNDDFQALAREIAQHIVETNPTHVTREEAGDAADAVVLLEQPFFQAPEKTVEMLVKEKIAKTGENMKPRRFVRFAADGAILDAYIHAGGKVGVLLQLDTPNVTDDAKAFAHDVCLHIAAMSPSYVHRGEIPQAATDHQRDIFTAQAAETGKPANIAVKIAEGRLNKWAAEVCLLDQPFVKDQDKTVAAVLKEKAPGATISRFVRWQMGEGLEKRVFDLAKDIAEMQAK